MSGGGGDVTAAQKLKFSFFFDMVPTHNHHPSYAKHVLGIIYVFFFGYWVWPGGGEGVSSKGLVHNLLMQFFILDSSRLKVSQLFYFNIVNTYNDHPSYVKHVLARNYVPPPPLI